MDQRHLLAMVVAIEIRKQFLSKLQPVGESVGCDLQEFHLHVRMPYTGRGVGHLHRFVEFIPVLRRAHDSTHPGLVEDDSHKRFVRHSVPLADQSKP